MDKEDKRIITMKSEKPLKAVFKMGIPVTIGMLFMVFYNLVDTYFIGLLHDDNMLAASNLSYPVLMILIALAGIVGNGCASYIARCIGAKKDDEAIHTLTIGFEMIVMISVFISLLGFIYIDSLVNMLGAKLETFEFTKDYVLVLILGSIFVIGNYAIGQLLRSEGSTYYSMVGMVAGTIANIILDPIFIFSFGMGIKGAAIATVIANGISTLIYLYYYARKKTLLMPSIHMLKMDGLIIKEIMAVGIPHTLEQLFSTAAIIVCNNLAAGYSTLHVAAIGVANKVMSFGQYIYQGMTAGCQPLMGYNYGAKNYERLKSIIKTAIISITLMEFGVMILFGVYAPVFISVFSETSDVVDIGANTLRAFMHIFPFVVTVAVVRNAFNSIGKAMWAFWITVVRQVVLYIPFLVLFNKVWGYNGLIHAQVYEEALCMILAFIVLFKFLDKDSKLKFEIEK